LVARHEQEWASCWSASGVELDDPDFQLWWYRMVYYLRCFAKPGAAPVGLFAGLASNNTPWHGDYHHNYNAWQPYWTPLIINHPDLTDPWMRYMKQMLPRLRWFAKTTYDCEGAFVGISSFAFEPDPANCESVNRRQIAIPRVGYTLGMAGMSAQILWFTHLYRPDRKYLEEMIYPVLREVALFYASFAEKCPRDANGKAKFGPSFSPEHGKFGVENVPFDLAYARFTLNAAITAATELGRDSETSARFRKALDLLPPYPTAPDEAGQPIVVDWTGCQFREIKTHNITVPVVPVFPGDQVTWFSPEPEKELFRNTIRQTRHRGCNSTVILSVAKARFSMPEAPGDLRSYYKPEAQPNGMFHWPMHGYYLSESVGIAAAISEFLLQSVDNTIRVFPCWPKDKDARFANLRAQGGFLVSAEQRAGQIVKLNIVSTVGGPLRLLDPRTGKLIHRATKPGETVAMIP
jgi:alpha-L-fucosidase 2